MKIFPLIASTRALNMLPATTRNKEVALAEVWTADLMVWISYKPLHVTLIEKISNLHALYSESVLHRTLKIGLVNWQHYNGDTLVLDTLSMLNTVQKSLLLI